ncbi:zinc metalloproteinase nas-13-like [Pararge aegeria]|uniref:Metalloendopeptidase n=1 Tax=Pararge aegeria aegeria TaxID=348720 RepID=A0A8S4RLH7_9NEOP|nr:zinc metalloproteinase nas-13-like [Pararge aegeria]CAH2237519.1 jg4293 [Pararge aegeria aegeria]
MEVFFLLISIVLFSGSKAFPVDDDDSDIIIVDSVLENSIDGDDSIIDVSSLGPEAFGIPKNESGDNVAEWTESSLMNPEEMGGYAEGDILMPKFARNGIRERTVRWENGIIPYAIDKAGYNRDQQDMIMKAIADYHRLTCLRFVPYSGQTDYIIIKNTNTGCWSSVGRTGGRQEVNLQAPGCVSKKGTILHELLHAIGFLHEQSRPERDDFVYIQYSNIKPGAENNFKKADTKRTSDFGVSYDYNSVMHYSEYAFSKNSQKTIVPKIKDMKLGQREGLSRGDVKKVNNMYNCKKEEPTSGWVGQVWQSFFGTKT